jgi:23S rRNA pseudouridine1911/1915/1917 synthase
MDRPGSARRRAVRPAGPGELEIVYQDDALVVVNKPSGLLTVPLAHRGDPSVAGQLLAHFHSRGKRRPLVVHRIDRDTSGLVMFAMHPEAHARLKEQFKRHEPEAGISGGGLRPPVACVRHLARSPRVGSAVAHPEGDASA